MLKPVEIIDRGRGPELATKRITVYDIIPYLEAGDRPNLIAVTLRMSTEQVLALMDYIEKHKDEIMAVHREIEERFARGNSPEIKAKFRKSHAKLMALKKKLDRQKKEKHVNAARNPRGQ